MPTYEGSISTKWIEGAERVCIKCGAPIKNIARDIGEVRTRYGGFGHGKREIVCMTCHMRSAREKLGR